MLGAQRSTGSASRATSASSAWPRPAATRRIVAPVKAALEPLAAIYARLKGDVSVLHAARENLLLPVDLVHAPTGTRDRGRRARRTSPRSGSTALELYPADAPLGFDLAEHAALCREWCARTDAPRPRAGRQGLRLRRASSASAPTTTRCATSPCRPWATRR